MSTYVEPSPLPFARSEAEELLLAIEPLEKNPPVPGYEVERLVPELWRGIDADPASEIGCPDALRPVEELSLAPASACSSSLGIMDAESMPAGLVRMSAFCESDLHAKISQSRKIACRERLQSNACCGQGSCCEAGRSIDARRSTRQFAGINFSQFVTE